MEMLFDKQNYDFGFQDAFPSKLNEADYSILNDGCSKIIFETALDYFDVMHMQMDITKVTLEAYQECHGNQAVMEATMVNLQEISLEGIKKAFAKFIGTLAGKLQYLWKSVSNFFKVFTKANDKFLTQYKDLKGEIKAEGHDLKLSIGKLANFNDAFKSLAKKFDSLDNSLLEASEKKTTKKDDDGASKEELFNELVSDMQQSFGKFGAKSTKFTYADFRDQFSAFVYGKVVNRTYSAQDILKDMDRMLKLQTPDQGFNLLVKAFQDKAKDIPTGAGNYYNDKAKLITAMNEIAVHMAFVYTDSLKNLITECKQLVVSIAA